MYLFIVCGERTVPIELGQSYQSEDSSQHQMTINTFIDDYICSQRDGVGYLAQHQFIRQVPTLRKDFCVPDFCALLLPEDVVAVATTSTTAAATTTIGSVRAPSSWFATSNEAGLIENTGCKDDLPNLTVDECHDSSIFDRHRLHKSKCMEWTATVIMTATMSATNTTDQINVNHVSHNNDNDNTTSVSFGYNSNNIDSNDDGNDDKDALHDDDKDEEESDDYNDDDDYNNDDNDDDVLIHFWFGPSTTQSPLHHDPYHNLLCQVHGYKYVRLYPYYQPTTGSLYPRQGIYYNNRYNSIAAV